MRTTAASRLPRSRRRAFTLVEMIVVLAILAVLSAIAWPAVRNLLAKSELQNAAKQVRTALVRARLDAMESGTIRQFRYQPGTGRYEVSIVTALDESQAADEEVESDSADDPRLVLEDVLPGSVVFEGFDELGELLPTADASESPVEPIWSTPILLYPNGRTSDARIRFFGQRGQSIELRLRGMTGTVAIGPVEPAPSLDSPEATAEWPEEQIVPQPAE